MSKTKNSTAVKKSGGSGKLIGISCLIAIGVLIVGIAIAALWVLSNPFGNDQAAITSLGVDDSTSPETLSAWREEEASQLSSYGWVDEASGVVRIPIDQAMALVAERGLPVGTEGMAAPEAELVATPALEGEGEEPPSEESPAAEEAPPTPEGEGEEPPSEERPAAEEAPPTPTPEAEEPTPEPTVNLAEVSFQAHVLPIFEQHCMECHSAAEAEEGLILETYEDIMAGSWNGSVIEPEDVENSYLIEQVVTGRMPKEGPRLTPAEIEILTAWVEAGAPDN